MFVTQVLFGVQFAGEKLALAPAGKPEALKVTAAAVPTALVTVIAAFGVVAPCMIVPEAGTGLDKVKSKMPIVTLPGPRSQREIFPAPSVTLYLKL
jgi:hypothetical protein